MTKALVRAKLPLYDSVNVIPGMLDITHATQHRRGVRHPERRASFAYKPAVMVLVALVALGAVGLLCADAAARRSASRAYGLALILGGACGNLIDRAHRRARAGFRRCLLARRIISGPSTWRIPRLQSAWC